LTTTCLGSGYCGFSGRVPSSYSSPFPLLEPNDGEAGQAALDAKVGRGRRRPIRPWIWPRPEVCCVPAPSSTSGSIFRFTSSLFVSFSRRWQRAQSRISNFAGASMAPQLPLSASSGRHRVPYPTSFGWQKEWRGSGASSTSARHDPSASLSSSSRSSCPRLGRRAGIHGWVFFSFPDSFSASISILDLGQCLCSPHLRTSRCIGWFLISWAPDMHSWM
jgi:hypothetical protein